jgi:hypothetical protein|tara:strand:+ start:58 stop:219 length:162 start_codon:yes stop_codon:yes gene_type:complete
MTKLSEAVAQNTRTTEHLVNLLENVKDHKEGVWKTKKHPFQEFYHMKLKVERH